MNDRLGSLGSSSQKTSESTEGLHGGLISLAAGLEVANIALDIMKEAWELVEGPIEKAIDLALEAEQSQNLLTGALVSSGQYTQELATDLNEYAESTAQATGTSAELIRTHVAYGIQAGLTVEKSQEMEEASRKLATIMGGDVDKAFHALQQSLQGHARGLAMVLPQVKDLGTAQLQGGAAIDIVNQALTAQYEAYQSSLPAAIARSKEGYQELLVAFGEGITQSPVLASLIDSLGRTLNEMAQWVGQNKSQITGWVNDALLKAVDAIQFLNNAIDVVYRAGSVAFNSLGAAINTVILAAEKSVEGFYSLLSHLPGEIGKNAKEGMAAMQAASEVTSAAVKQNASNVVDSLNNQTTASAALDKGLTAVKDRAVESVAAHQANAAAIEQSRESASAFNKTLAETAASYGDYEIGTLAERIQLNAQEQDRADALKKFTKYYDDKIALAVSKEAEEQSQIASYTAKKVKGMGGKGELNIQNDAEIKGEKVKQQQLKALKDQELITDEQYAQLKESEEEESEGRLVDIATAHYTAEANLQDKLGNSWEATMIRIENAQGKHGKVMATMQAIQASDEYKATDTALTNLSSLRSSHSQAAFAIGKAAAIAQTTIHTFMSAEEAYAALAGIPIVGPALGAAAAAAAIAAGFVQIQSIESQQMQQAHGGLDSVPESDNQTYTLSAGERVVQPQANKDLTDFLAAQKGGGAGGKQVQVMATVNLTVNDASTADKNTIKKTAQMLVDEIRRMSERGQQIINVKGVYGGTTSTGSSSN